MQGVRISARGREGKRKRRRNDYYCADTQERAPARQEEEKRTCLPLVDHLSRGKILPVIVADLKRPSRSVVWFIDIEPPNPSEEQCDDAHNVGLDLLPRNRLPLDGHALSHWTHRSSCSTSCRQYSSSGRGWVCVLCVLALLAWHDVGETEALKNTLLLRAHLLTACEHQNQDERQNQQQTCTNMSKCLSSQTPASMLPAMLLASATLAASVLPCARFIKKWARRRARMRARMRVNRAPPARAGGLPPDAAGNACLSLRPRAHAAWRRCPRARRLHRVRGRQAGM
jgi:hypothetical protein